MLPDDFPLPGLKVGQGPQREWMETRRHFASRHDGNTRNVDGLLNNDLCGLSYHGGQIEAVIREQAGLHGFEPLRYFSEYLFLHVRLEERAASA